MKNCLLYVKNAVRSPLVLLLLIVTMLISGLSFGYRRVSKNLPCAVCSEDDSPLSAAVLDYLEDFDFLVLKTREDVARAVRDGRADCGAVLLTGFADRAKTGDLTGCCQLLTSARSAFSSAYSMIVMSGIYTVCTPGMTGELFAAEGYALTDAQLEDYFARAAAEITPLTFSLTNAEGEELSFFSTDMPVGIAAICLFLAYGFFSVGIVRRRGRLVRARFSSGNFYKQVVFVHLVSFGLLLGLFGAAGVTMGRKMAVFPLGRILSALLIYLVLLTLFFMILIMLPAADHTLVCFLAADALLSLALCPLHHDAALTGDWVSVLRVFTVPYWMYVFV